MTAHDLLHALGDIDDDILVDAAVKKTPVKRLRWIAGIAACVVLLAAVGGVWAHQHRADTAPPSDSDFLSPQIAANSRFSPDNDSTQIFDTIVYPTENEPCNNASSMSCWIYTPPFTFADLAEKTTHIVCVKVIEEHYEPHDNHTAYFVTLKIQAVLKGSLAVGDEILYADNGGIIHYETGHKGRTHCGGPLLEEGNYALLFMTDKDLMHPTAEGEATYHYSDASISKFFLDVDGKYHASGTYSHAYQTYGYCDMPHELTDYTPKTLDEIRALIDEKE